MLSNDTVRFEIKEGIAVLKRYDSGWSKELNLVSWNGGNPKYDIRDWSEDHSRMSRGVTLTAEEMIILKEVLVDYGRLKNAK